MNSLITKERLMSLAMLLWITLAPVRPAMAVVLVLPIIDFVLGVTCAFRAKRTLTSAGFKRTIAKVFLYEIATVLAFLVETWLTGPIVPAIKMVTGLIGVTELKSCLEHLDELGGNPIFASLLDKLAPPHPPQSPNPPASNNPPTTP